MGAHRRWVSGTKHLRAIREVERAMALLLTAVHSERAHYDFGGSIQELVTYPSSLAIETSKHPASVAVVAHSVSP
jgi:phage baseplate assembly protein W